MSLTRGLYTDGKTVVVLSDVDGKGARKTCYIFRTLPFNSGVQEISAKAFEAKYPHKVTGVQLQEGGQSKKEKKLRPGMYTDGKVVVTIHHMDGALTVYRDLPFHGNSLQCSEAELRKRYPYRIDGVVVE